MKKLLTFLTFIIICFSAHVSFARETANIPSCSVTLNGKSVDNSYRQFPLLQYKDIVYFPMTYYDCRFLGVYTDWNERTSTLYINTENISGAYRKYNWEWKNGKRNEIDICKSNIVVNSKVIDNSKEEYPLITFRDVTYFPLTWRFAVDEFGWEYSYDDKNGLVITADNYICKTLDLPDLRTQVTPDGATDGKYYYYTGNDKKVYRTPIDNTEANELIYTTAHNHYFQGGNNNVEFSVQGDDVYLSYRTGASMGTNYRVKINPDGTTEDSKDGSYHESFLGGSEYVYDCDGFTVRVYRGGYGNSRVIYHKGDSENAIEILSDGIVFAEIRSEDFEYYGNVEILGNNIYLTGYNKTNNENSVLSRYDVQNETLTPLIENVAEFVAFTGWDNDTKSNSDMIVYYQDGKMYRYSSASNKTIVINENSLPLVRGVLTGSTLYLHTKNEEKTVVEMYLGYGIGSAAGAHIFETTLPTDSYIKGGMLITESYGDADGEKDIRTCVFNKPAYFFRSSDNMQSDFFLHNGKLIYTPTDDTTLIEVDLNKN